MNSSNIIQSKYISLVMNPSMNAPGYNEDME